MKIKKIEGIMCYMSTRLKDSGISFEYIISEDLVSCKIKAIKKGIEITEKIHVNTLLYCRDAAPSISYWLEAMFNRKKYLCHGVMQNDKMGSIFPRTGIKDICS